jgi:hypothetical protein
MKLEKQFRIIAIIIGTLVIVTAAVSLCYILYPLFTGMYAPKIILNVLTVLNLIIPLSGIGAMCTFIILRHKGHIK